MKQRRKLALEQNPNGFRHLYGTADLDAAAARPIEWEEVETEEKTTKKEGDEDGDIEEGDGEEEAVDQFLADIGDSGDEADPSVHDPDFIPTPLMQQFKVNE